MVEIFLIQNKKANQHGKPLKEKTHAAKKIKRGGGKRAEKFYGQEIEHHLEYTGEAILRFSPCPRKVVDRNFGYFRPGKPRVSGDKPVHLTIEGKRIDKARLIGLQSASVIF